MPCLGKVDNQSTLLTDCADDESSAIIPRYVVDNTL